MLAGLMQGGNLPHSCGCGMEGAVELYQADGQGGCTAITNYHWESYSQEQGKQTSIMG